MKEKAIERLKEQFEKTDNMGKIIINNCLLPRLNENPEYSEKILAEGKTIKGCLSSIKSWVQKSKNHAPSHDVIFSAAIHYFQEEKPEYVKEIFEEEPLVFGNISKEFNTPVVKFITGTVIRETVKEVTSKPAAKDTIKKVKKTVEDKMKEAGYISMFDEEITNEQL